MFVDHNYNYLMPLRAVLSDLMLPFERTAETPARVVDFFATTFSSRKKLLVENEYLKAKQLLLEAKVSRIMGLEKENRALRTLLDSSINIEKDVSVAEIFSVQGDRARQQLTINKGKKDKVYTGQPIVGARGVVGQVISVSKYTSQVLLITDVTSAIPVQISRNGVRAIAKGNGAVNKLSLLHLPQTVDIKIGDELITSGLGQRYPYGYPVGKVTKVVNEPGTQFSSIIVVPFARLDRMRQVLMVWQDHHEQTA